MAVRVVIQLICQGLQERWLDVKRMQRTIGQSSEMMSCIRPVAAAVHPPPAEIEFTNKVLALLFRPRMSLVKLGLSRYRVNPIFGGRAGGEVASSVSLGGHNWILACHVPPAGSLLRYGSCRSGPPAGGRAFRSCATE